MRRIPLQSWAPDLQGLTNQGTSDTKNVLPVGSGYAPLRDLLAVSTNALDGIALGAISALSDTGTTETFAGDTSKLYLLVGNSFSDVSRSGGYSVGTNERWEAAQYGRRVIFTQIGTPPQYFDMTSSSLFDDLGGSPPQARHIAVVRDFVVLGNTVTSPQQIYWSGFNNSDQWTQGTNQCDAQTLQSGGAVQRIVGGEVGYIFSEHAITRMTYVGSPIIFQIDLLEDARGLAASGSLVRVGAAMYFLAQDGFYVKNGDAPSQSIGNQKVDSWFFAHLQPETLSQITSGVDPSGKFVYWSFVSTDSSTSTRPDTVLIYNWAEGEWAYGKINHEMLFTAISVGLTLEQLGAIYPNLETVPLSLDDRAWAGGNTYLAAFNTDHELCAFNGSTLAATMQTSDFEGTQSKRSIILDVFPFTDTENATVICRSRERFADTLADTQSSAMETNGSCALMSTGRYHQLELQIPAGEEWTYATGLDVDVQDDGEV